MDTAKTDHIKAFIAAQKDMEPARKAANNPHFKSKYADLATVQDACFPALHAHGFMVSYPHAFDDAGNEYVETRFTHESGESFSTRVKLIIGKNDMQGYGSAITYARRYGLMSLAGIAPEDDDGNDAVKRKRPEEPEKDRPITEDEFIALRDLIEQAGADEDKFCAFLGVSVLDALPFSKLANARAALSKKINGKAA